MQYLAPECEEQWEVCKPDCNKFSQKVRSRLERCGGRGFQFWNLLHKVNDLWKRNGSPDSIYFSCLLFRATLLYMYFGGHLGITVWRTSWFRQPIKIDVFCTYKITNKDLAPQNGANPLGLGKRNLKWIRKYKYTYQNSYADCWNIIDRQMA